MECPEYLKPFVSASQKLAELVDEVEHRFMSVTEFFREHSRLTNNRHSDAVLSRQLHAVLSQHGGCHDYSGLAVEMVSVGLGPEEIFRQAHVALLPSQTTAIKCAGHLQNSLTILGFNSPPEGVALVTAQGINPKIAGTITAFMLLPAAFAAQAAPLLAHSFARLAAVPDLSLPYGRLVSIPETGEIRLIPGVDKESQKVGSDRETASTFKP